MKTTIRSFYNFFYGPNFFRHFRRPPDFQLKGFKIQEIVKNPKELFRHVHRNSGFHPCLTHVYNHGLVGNLKRQNPGRMVFDRAFFDFDVNNPKMKELKNNLIELRSKSLKFEEDKQAELKRGLREALVNDEIVKPAIDEAKDFAIRFKESFDREPILFFSGCKGAHAYLFFNPINVIKINRALSWFGDKIKTVYKYRTLDLSVLKNAKSRLSRVPYSKHQYTDLAVVPFQVDDDYDQIMDKSLNPVVEPFTREDYLSSFGEYLKKLDPILEHNEKVGEAEKKATRGHITASNRVKDHREWFRSFLGEPAYKSPFKPYVMYNCPFSDHEDHHPSFMVYPTGYKCHGCGRKGNYFQFLKDYYGWSNKQVKNYLKSVKC